MLSGLPIRRGVNEHNGGVGSVTSTGGRLDIGALQAQREELGLTPGTELEKPLPWLYQVRHVLFGWWEDIEDDSIQCTYLSACSHRQAAGDPGGAQECHSALQEILRCGRQPAGGGGLSLLLQASGLCPYKTFTNLPPGLVPYSRWSLEVHLEALQQYAWGRGVYRRVGQRLGVSTATAYRWVSVWGTELLPVAALFGSPPDFQTMPPLELAGYDVRKLPIAQICRGKLLDWPAETLGELVPNA